MAETRICALFRQSWYEAARQYLSNSDRLQFYEVCFGYQFYGKEPAPEDISNAAVGAMFAMVKPLLSEDRQKAINIAERNRRNGASGGRPPKSNILQQEDTSTSETQKNPKENLGYFGEAYTNTNTYTQQNTTVCTIQKEGGEILDTHTKFLIFLKFFEFGSKDPAAEYKRFYDYYDSRGWTVGDGKPVQNVVSLAGAWRISDVDRNLKDIRAHYTKMLQYFANNGGKLNDFLFTDFISAQVFNDAHKLTLTFYGSRCSEYLFTTYGDLMQKYIDQTLPSGWQVAVKENPVINL